MSPDRPTIIFNRVVFPVCLGPNKKRDLPSSMTRRISFSRFLIIIMPNIADYRHIVNNISTFFSNDFIRSPIGG